MDSSERISAQELLNDLRAAGVALTADQLRRWQREGLIPRPKQQAHGRGLGSTTYYPARAGPQTRRVAQLVRERRDFRNVGWQLWFEGFEVDESHWRPVLNEAAALLRQVSRIVPRWMRRDEARDSDAADTAYDHVAHGGKAGPLLAAMWRRVRDDDRSRFVRVVAMICAGREPSAEQYEEAERSADLEAFFKLSGLQQSNRDNIDGRRFLTTSAIGPTLRTVATCMLRFQTKFTSEQQAIGGTLIEARDYFRDGITVFSQFHSSTAWIFGRNAFGLGALVSGWRLLPPKAQAATLLIWHEYMMSAGEDIYSKSDLDELREQAARLFKSAEELRRLASEPRFALILNPQQMRNAFKSRVQFELFIFKLRAARGA